MKSRRPPMLTAKLAAAFQFAQLAHSRQVRKRTGIPYISHPMAVAALVLEYGGDEDQAVAALLHDTIEDCGVTHDQLDRFFGPRVARAVKDCTDGTVETKRDNSSWQERKERYVAHLRQADTRSLLVSAADKLHNARAIVRDVRRKGPGVWGRFNADRDQIVRYYESLVVAFGTRTGGAVGEFRALLNDLAAAVADMKRLAA